MQRKNISSNAAQIGSILVVHDLTTTYLRRVQLIVFASCYFLLGSGIAFAFFFGAQGHFLLVGLDAGVAVVACGLLVLARRGYLRQAVLGLFGTLFCFVFAVAVVLDAQVPGAQRSMHYYFVPLAAMAFLVMRAERGLLRYGYPLVCLACFVWLAGGDNGWPAHYAIAAAQRPPVWLICALALGIFHVLVHLFVGDIDTVERHLHDANERFVSLVRGMFPKVIAERLLIKDESFAQQYADCSILFADIVGFTSISSQMSAESLVGMLNRIFSAFDEPLAELGLTKIKTIGDAYMVAAGVPEEMPDHAKNLIVFAKHMLSVVREFPGIQLRIGIASGSLIGGVIGRSRQVFDVWGEVVNMASLIESTGVVGRVQVSEATYQWVRDDFQFHRRETQLTTRVGDPVVVYLLEDT